MAGSPHGDQWDRVEAACGAPWRDLPERYGPWQTCHATPGSLEGHPSPTPRRPRPITPRPDRLIADNGYRYPRCRRWLRQRQIPHTIPERRDQRAQRAVRPGRPLRFDKAIYARRNVVERCLNRLKQWRGLTTRHEKRAVNYRAMLVLASIVLWLEG